MKTMVRLLLSSALRAVRGFVFMLAMTVGVATCSVWTLPWLVTLFVPIPAVHRWRRWYAESLNKMYFLFNATMLVHLCGTSLFVYAKDGRIEHDKNILFLSNHRTRVDWMYAGWLYAACLRYYPNLSFVLKNDLKTWPFFGWCMQMMMYVFLSRKRDNDLPRIRQCVSYLANRASSLALFLFPEGTDLSPTNVLKSDQCEYLVLN
jgi:lysocardiolipin and lysophospholipid acyltransferase